MQATQQQRAEVIRLTRRLQELLPVDNLVIKQVERKARVGDLSSPDAMNLIDALTSSIIEHGGVDRTQQAV